MLEDLTPKVRIFPCGIRDIILSLNDTDAAILRDALANKEAWSNRGLSNALTAKGIPAGEKLIRDRREKACQNCLCR